MNESPTPKRRGGARPGAGRKPGAPTVKITVYILPATLAALKTIDPNVSHAIDRIVKEQTK